MDILDEQQRKKSPQNTTSQKNVRSVKQDIKIRRFILGVFITGIVGTCFILWWFGIFGKVKSTYFTMIYKAAQKLTKSNFIGMVG